MSAILHEVSAATPKSWSLRGLFNTIASWLREEPEAPIAERSFDRFDVEVLVREAGRERADMLTRWSNRIGD